MLKELLTVSIISATMILASCVEQKEPKAKSSPIGSGGNLSTSISATGPVTANGEDSSTVSITLSDSGGESIVGMVPTFSATGSGNIYGRCSASDADGKSTCLLKSTGAGTKTLRITYPADDSTATVVFVNGDKAKLGFTALPTSDELLGELFAFQPVVTVQDAFGNTVADATDSITLSAYSDSDCTTPVGGTFNVTTNPLNADGSSGSAAFSGVSYNKWEDIYLKATAAGLDAVCSTVVRIRQIVSTDNSSITGTNTTADGTSTSTITITLVDTSSNKVVGVVPSFSATDTGSTNQYGACGATDANGESTCTLKSTKAESKALTLTSPVSMSGGTTVEFSPGAANADKSSITGTSNIVADGVAASSITITILDEFDNPRENEAVAFTATGSNNTIGVCPNTDANGVSTCTLKSTKAEEKIPTITAPAINKDGGAVTFINGPLDTLTFTTPPTSSGFTNLALDDQPAVYATDANSNPITATDIDITLGAYTDAACSTTAGGTLSATSNPLTTSGGAATYAGVMYSDAETIYLKAFSGTTSVCSNAINVQTQAELSYSLNEFDEDEENIGAIATTIGITLTGADSFTEGDIRTKISTANLPAGLTLGAARDSATHVTLSLTGNATYHSDASDAGNLTITFEDTAFTNGDASDIANYSKDNLVVDFIDPYTLSYSATGVTEAASNIGAITDSITVTLAGDTFKNPLTEDTDVTFSNVPAGLDATLSMSGDTGFVLSFSGEAAAHSATAAISNFTISFADSAFVKGKAAGVLDSTKNDISINFIDPASLSYDTATFNEALSNIGAISGEITITLSGDTFENDLSDPVITTDNLPAALSAVFTRESDTTVKMSLSGEATAHADSDQVNNLTVNFSANAFSNNTNAANVIGNNKNDLVIDFDDPASLSFSSTAVEERAQNDGAIEENIVVTLTGDTFASDISGLITAANVPASLSAQFTRLGDTQVRLSFTGNADSHASADNIANMSIDCTAAAFVNNTKAENVVNNGKNDFQINFLDPAKLTYASDTFNEDESNDGTINNEITITLTGDNFETDISNAITANNVPAGLSATFTRDSVTQIRMELSGNAVNHTNGDNASNIEVVFQDSAFKYSSSATNVENYQKSDLKTDYLDPDSLSYSGDSLSEATSNDGSIAGNIEITLSTPENGEKFAETLTGKVSASNVPAGLTANFFRSSDTLIILTLLGNANSHSSADSISNLTVTFTKNAFQKNSSASNVANTTKSDLIISYLDPASLTYETTSFGEAISNTGAIDATTAITLSGDTFNDPLTEGTHYSFSNVPAGLDPGISRVDATNAILSFSASANNHANGDDTSLLTLTFANDAFAGNSNASNIVNYSQSLSLDFTDPASLSYSGNSFSETSANTGAISDTITVTLSGDTFATGMAEGTDVNFSNVPDGLDAVISRDSATTATIRFNGNATAHEATSGIGNFGVEFEAGAFTNNTVKTNVANWQVTDMSISFQDQARLSYSPDPVVLDEVTANTGAVDGNVIITLSGDTFVNDPALFIDTSNVPNGLSPVFTKDGPTQITLSFSGTAAAHEATNSIGDLGVTFSDDAFTNNTNASNVANYDKEIAINFADKASLSYNPTILNEASSNDGALDSGTIIVTLTNDTFVSDITGKVAVSNLPAGLSATMGLNSNVELQIDLIGNATNHANANDIGDLTVTFAGTAFANNTDATLVTNYQKNDLVLNFNDPASLSYSDSGFSEDNSNTGAISATLAIDLDGDTFKNPLEENTDYVFTNFPTGLDPAVNYINGTQVTVSFSGNADNHTSGDNKSDFTLEFRPSAFTNNTVASNVTNYKREDMTISFTDPASLAWSTTSLNESVKNIGEITESITVTLSGDTFKSSLSVGSDVLFSSPPAGLTANLTRNSDTSATISFSGNADSHDSGDSISAFAATFAAGAFSNNTVSDNVTNSSVNNISINFDDPASLAYSTETLNEVSANTGAVSDPIIITLSGDTFVDNLTNLINTSNFPLGLSPEFNRDSGTQLTMTLSGTAVNHESSDSATAAAIVFSANAFNNNTVAANVSNYQKNDISVNFNDAAYLTYAPDPTVVNENASNAGAVDATIGITLTNDTFEGHLGGDIFISNLPSGLSGEFERINSTLVVLSFNGNASAHEAADSVGNVTVTFLDSAFVNNTDQDNVTNSTKDNISVIFDDASRAGGLAIAKGEHISSQVLDETIYLAYYDQGRIKLARSKRGRKHKWRISVLDKDIGEYPQSERNIDLSVQDHKIHLCYYDYNTQTLKFAGPSSNGRGLQITSIRQTDSNSDNYGKFCSIKNLGPENIYISYYDVENFDLKMAVSRDRGKTWRTRLVHDGNGITSDFGQFSSLGVDTSVKETEHIFVSYYDSKGQDLRLANSKDGGENWNFELLDDGDGLDHDFGKFSRIKVVDKFNIFISYQGSGRAGHDLKFVRSRKSDNGRKFDRPIIVHKGDGITTSYGNHIAMETTKANGEVHICHQEEISQILKFARSTDGGKRFSMLETLDNSGQVGAYCSISIDKAKAGGPYIFYNSREDGALRVLQDIPMLIGI